MDFPAEVYLPQKTLFRKDAVLDLAREVEEFGASGLIVHGRSFEQNGIWPRFREIFSPPQAVCFFCRRHGEPSLDEISQVIEAARAFQADWIAGIGGGSVLDLAKAAAGLFHAEELPVYYQEGGGLKKPGIPFMAVPTTAGTGSEATTNSVIINPKKKTKLSIRDKRFLARKVILDPGLLKGLPRSVMGFAAMDALVQAYESFVSRYATRFTESLALEAVRLLTANLPPALENGEENYLGGLLAGSYLAGIALAHSRLGVIHGLAHPLGVLYDVPHGLVCSVCFIPALRLNRKATDLKYGILSRAVDMDFEEKVRSLLKILDLPSPFRGRPLPEKEKIMSETLQSLSTAANPKPITREDVEFLLKEIF